MNLIGGIHCHTTCKPSADSQHWCKGPSHNFSTFHCCKLSAHHANKWCHISGAEGHTDASSQAKTDFISPSSFWATNRASVFQSSSYPSLLLSLFCGHSWLTTFQTSSTLKKYSPIHNNPIQGPSMILLQPSVADSPVSLFSECLLTTWHLLHHSQGAPHASQVSSCLLLRHCGTCLSGTLSSFLCRLPFYVNTPCLVLCACCVRCPHLEHVGLHHVRTCYHPEARSELSQVVGFAMSLLDIPWKILW